MAKKRSQVTDDSNVAVEEPEVAEETQEEQPGLQGEPFVEQDEELQDPSASVQSGEEEEPSLLDRLADLPEFEGLDDERAAQDRLLEHYRTTAEEAQRLRGELDTYRDLAQYGGEYLRLREDPSFSEWQQAQSQPQQQETPPEKPWWAPPDFDMDSLENYKEFLFKDGQPVRDPNTGAYAWQWKESTPLEYRKRAEEYQQYLQDWSRKLHTEPDKVLPQVIEHHARQLFERMFSERDGQARQETFVERTIRENSDWLYEKNAEGKFVYTPGQSEPNLSADGLRMAEYMEKLMAIVPDPQARWTVARQQLENEQLKAQLAATGSATNGAEKAQQKKQEHLRRAASIPNRGASIPKEKSEHSQNRHVKAGQKLMQQMHDDGLGENLSTDDIFPQV